MAETASRTAALGGVALIAACFFASAVLRLGDLGVALAQEPGLLGKEPASLGVCDAADADGLLAAIREREAQLERESDRLVERGQALAVAEARLAEQLEAFETARAGLEATLTMADEATERDLALMTAVYERMKPPEAAGIVERMDLGFAAGLLSRMNPENAAGILTSMEAETAYAITLMLASRNARAPRE